MTEQEKREKAIEEMARIMCNAKETCGECIGRKSNVYFRDISDCKYYYGATRAFNASYRKEEEVRKETAREILHRIWVMLPYKDDPKASGTDLFWIETIENIADDFGVEVE